MDIRTAGIIGAGTMGNGIAQACAVAGLRAVMVDISDAAVQKGAGRVPGSDGGQPRRVRRLQYRPCPLLREVVAAGRLGRKSGRGVYTY
jgi:3-hydroxyacyl-CoA dehydrogenase